MPENATVDATPTETIATPSSEPMSPTGTVDQTPPSQAEGTAPSEETFYTGDVTKLPPELRQHYNNMLTDYKRKTTEIASKQKEFLSRSEETQAALRKAEAFEQLSNDPRFQQWAEQQKQSQAPVQEKPILSDDEWRKSFESPQAFMDMQKKLYEDMNSSTMKEIQELRQAKVENESAEIIDSFINESDDKGTKPYGDLLQLDKETQGLITGFIRINPPSKPGADSQRAALKAAYDYAKGVTQSYYEKGKREALGILEKKAAGSIETPSLSGKDSYAGKNPRELTGREAFEMALRGQRVSD